MKAGFLNFPILEDRGGVFTLKFPLKFYSAELRGYLVAPAGMETDLASIPRGLWNLFPKVGRYDAPAVIHDAGYQRQLETPGGIPVFLIKPLVDRVFYEAMLSMGVGKTRAWLMYKAVSLFGRGRFGA